MKMLAARSTGRAWIEGDSRKECMGRVSGFEKTLLKQVATFFLKWVTHPLVFCKPLLLGKGQTEAPFECLAWLSFYSPVTMYFLYLDPEARTHSVAAAP